MKALVLGATGMVGYELCKALKDDEWEVFGAARMSASEAPDRLRDQGIEPIRFDVTQDDPAALPDVDVVFLEIWDPSQPDLIWPINFYGVGCVVERYKGEADVVNGCTINVYGNRPQPSSEDTPCRPTNEYGRSRFAQERLIDFFCLTGRQKGIHVRYAHANSPERGIVRRFADAIIDDESLGSDPDAHIQVIALEDFVRVTVAAMSKADLCPPVVNCCHPKVWTKRELAQRIHEELGVGAVRFDTESGGRESSAYATADRMIEWFGPPQVSLDTLFRRVADNVRPLIA